MAGQTVNFEYDAESNILFVEDDYAIDTQQDADAFLRLYREQLERIGRKVWVVSSIDGLKVGPGALEYYGREMKRLAEQHAVGTARYGRNAMSRMALRTSMMRVGHETNIFDSKEQAVEAVKNMAKSAGR